MHGNGSYYKLGIPETISSPDDITTTINKLRIVSKEHPENLPRYNSRKSGKFFSYLTSYENIDTILSSFKTYEDKQKFLTNYSYTWSLSGIYFLIPGYQNEHNLSLSSGLYAKLRFIQLAEAELALTKRSFDQIGIDRDKRVIVTKQIGKSLWGLEQLNKDESVDPYVHETIEENLSVLKRMITQSKMIDQSIVFDPDKCFDFPNGIK